jgi:hypothetical protein
MGKDMLSIGRHNQSLYFNLSIGKAEWLPLSHIRQPLQIRPIRKKITPYDSSWTEARWKCKRSVIRKSCAITATSGTVQFRGRLYKLSELRPVFPIVFPYSLIRPA